MPSLIGNKPNQVPSNGDLGTMAFREQDQFVPTSGIGSTVQAYSAQLQSYAINGVAMRNRIINGQMAIAQRGTSFSGLSDDGGQYTLDRWRWSENGTFTGSQTVTQDSSAPAGFSNSLRVVTNTAVSVGTSLAARVEQFIEGFNTADLMWGTANAKTITLSFWVKSSLTGTFGGALRNSADNRSYPFTYTINAADTWEYETITIPGDTSGTWVGATNGVGVRITFSLGAGTALSGTAGAWAASGFQSATGAVSMAGTTSANWSVTGCQFEVGTQATSFEYRQYGQELALCQRYYQASIYSGSSLTLGGGGVAGGSGSGLDILTPLVVTMRIAPTVSVPTVTNGYFAYTSGGGTTLTNSGSGVSSSPTMVAIRFGGFSSVAAWSFVESRQTGAGFTATAEL